MRPLNICLQVNVDEEDSKSGVTPDALPALAAACVELPNIQLRGLMCLPAVREELDEQRVPFSVLRKLAEKLRTGGIDMDTLSMGMTADFRAAILEGATIVRIGTALFGRASKMDYGKVAYVGGGNMTRALAGGMLSAGYEPSHILISEPLAEHRETLA